MGHPQMAKRSDSSYLCFIRVKDILDFRVNRECFWVLDRVSEDGMRDVSDELRIWKKWNFVVYILRLCVYIQIKDLYNRMLSF